VRCNVTIRRERKDNYFEVIVNGNEILTFE
jgi:hypothetical protein